MPIAVNELLELRLRARGGIVLARDLRDCGYDRHGVAALVSRDLLRRVRAGAFVDSGRHRTAAPVARHALETRAVASSLGRGYAISHLSAIVTLGLPVLAQDLGPVHLSHVGSGTSRRDRRLHVHGPVPATDVVRHQGVPVVRPALALVQTADRSGVRAGLIAAEGALVNTMVTRDELTAQLRGPRAATARRVVAMASPASESPGESWCRLVFIGLGLPEPEQQVEIRDSQGRLVGRVDFLFRAAAVIVEFDGAVKYAGAEGREALVREKRREDALRAMGYRVVRLVWADLADPARVARLLLAQIHA